jgi:hypothetical protein
MLLTELGSSDLRYRTIVHRNIEILYCTCGIPHALVHNVCTGSQRDVMMRVKRTTVYWSVNQRDVY